MTPAIAYVTTASEAEALAIGRAVVEARLAASVNVLPGATSFYWWEGAVQESAEAVLILKTRDDLVDALVDKVTSMHSYECPCIVSWPITKGYRPYIEWVLGETKAVSQP